MLTVKFNKDIDSGTEQIAPLLLLPFVENTFKHGASESHFDARIDINLSLEKGNLIFTVENTKEPGPENTVKDNIGLTNVKRQLELMYKEYDLQLQNQPHIFNVHLSINLNSYATV